MTDKHDIDVEKISERKLVVTSEKLNFVLAICAILISAASFYATYLQADAAERQVKAMTLPLIQFTHGNWDNKQKIASLDFILKNAGIGPAIIKSIAINYRDKTYPNFSRFYLDCCLDKDSATKNTVNALTNPIINSILPGQSELKFISIEQSLNDAKFWQKLNTERKHLTLSICYCSMLDECYTTEKNGVVAAVQQCPVQTNN